TGVISSQAVCYHFWFGQAQLLLAALVLGGFACAKRGYGATACALVIAAGVVKLFPLVLVPWFVWRGGEGGRGLWRRVGAAVATGFFLTAATGWKLWNEFFRVATSIVNDFAPRRTFNFTVPSLVMNVYAVMVGKGASVVGLHEWWTVAEATGLVVIAAGYWLVWTRGDDREAEFCLLCVAMLAGSPVTWGHYFVFLIFPLAVTVARLRGKWTAARIAGFGSLLVALNVLDLAGRTWVKQSLVLLMVSNYIPLAGAIALGCLFVAWLGSGGERGYAAPSAGK
ncbi:MAG TPA: glycosyltransferase 87 family protein, partial [Verrucomicrobiae bacterium]|nr:glycosyltransferase 87 family protein [Verrucomicrobiae bacterium]